MEHTSNQTCTYEGHRWGAGPSPGLLVCCRKRCTAQAACPVCLAGLVPIGFLRVLCPRHTPPPAPLFAKSKPRSPAPAACGAQVSLWEEVN